MKKPIMSKRGRRFDEGGDVEAKMAGLEASNKEKPMGFFERLRAGNIDDPESEAYKRLGAGRNRAERIPVEDRSFTEVPPKIVSRDEGMGAFNQRLQASKNADTGITEGERIAQEMASTPDRVPSPRITIPTKPASKPAAKEFDPTAGEAKDKAAQAAADEQGDRPKVKVESIMKKKPVATASTFDAYGLNNFAKPKVEEEKPKSTYKKNSTSSPSGRKAGTSKSTKENDVDFGGTGLGMKRGGSVGKASSRADGIAQRGKTRGKMC
jgi:hypothetical protein